MNFFATRLAAFRAMMLRELAQEIVPGAKPKFHPNGDIILKGLLFRLYDDGTVVNIKNTVKVSHRPLEKIISTNHDQFVSKGDDWNHRNEQFDTYNGIRRITDPDGTVHLPLGEKPSIEGYEGYGIQPRPCDEPFHEPKPDFGFTRESRIRATKRLTL